MRTILIVALSLCAVTTCAVAANGSGDTFGGGGGPMPTLVFLQLEDLNGALTRAGYPQVDQVLFATGGGGYWGALDGIRIGGFGVGGDNVSELESRSASFDMEYGGMMVEKAVQAEENFTVVLGTMLGAGNLNLRLIDGLPLTFDEAVSHPFISSITKEFYAVQLYAAFEFKPSSRMWARFQLGFLWTLAGDWSFEETEFAGPPHRLGGLTASLMIRFGGGEGIPREDLETALEELSRELEALNEADLDSDQAMEPTEAETE